MGCIQKQKARQLNRDSLRSPRRSPTKFIKDHGNKKNLLLRTTQVEEESEPNYHGVKGTRYQQDGPRESVSFKTRVIEVPIESEHFSHEAAAEQNDGLTRFPKERCPSFAEVSGFLTFNVNPCILPQNLFYRGQVQALYDGSSRRTSVWSLQSGEPLPSARIFIEERPTTIYEKKRPDRTPRTRLVQKTSFRNRLPFRYKILRLDEDVVPFDC